MAIDIEFRGSPSKLHLKTAKMVRAVMVSLSRCRDKLDEITYDFCTHSTQQHKPNAGRVVVSTDDSPTPN